MRDGEWQSYLVASLISEEQRNTDVSHRPGEGFPGGPSMDEPLSPVWRLFDKELKRLVGESHEGSPVESQQDG